MMEAKPLPAQFQGHLASDGMCPSGMTKNRWKGGQRLQKKAAEELKKSSKKGCAKKGCVKKSLTMIRRFRRHAQ